MPQAVQFGAGNIGRGFLGQLLFEGGYQMTFVDANGALVEALNARGSYPLRLVTNDSTQELTVGALTALDVTREPKQVTQALLDADFISTAVGALILPKIAPTLAAGINARAQAGRGPVDILLCENQWHAAQVMRDALRPHLAPSARDYFQTSVGLVETVIGRMVPKPSDAALAEDSLLVVAEPYKELPIARAMLCAPAPTLPGLVLADKFDAYEARKLFLHNAGHAALAYLGYSKGHEFVWQCVEDSEVANDCRTALLESAQAVSRAYGFLPDELQAFTDDLFVRFASKVLGDTVARVAADPLRKLRAEDRLIGAANLCLRHGLVPTAFARVIAAALRYDNPNDPAAQQLQARRRSEGDDAVLQDVCGIAPETPLAGLVQEALAG